MNSNWPFGSSEGHGQITFQCILSLKTIASFYFLTLFLLCAQ